MVYTPLTVPITQALIAVEGKGLLSRPRSYKDRPRHPRSDKSCRFHNDYGHTTEECRHLKSEIERLIQNGYLQEYVCWEKARGTGPYQKHKMDKDKDVKNPSSGLLFQDMPRSSMTGKAEVNDPPRKGVIRMIVGGPAGGDSQRARKVQVREAYGTTVKEVMEVEPAKDAPLIQFDQEERNEPRTSSNDALVITILLANYEIEHVFIDSGSSADILFGEAYDQMQLGDVPLEAVDTSLYGFIGEVVHPRGMISLPLTLGTYPLQKTCLLKFLVVDIPSAYNVILGCSTINAFRAITSTYHMKIKFSVVGGVGEAQADALQARDRSKITKIGSKMKEDVRDHVVSCLRKNKDIFAWTPQDLEGIDLGVIMHHLNLDPTIRPVKQKK
ncbi:UNVERIFIED_CONTAM: hypothetical protein Slati_3771300 [Sesamum latifolium]|uniref:Reverse transcriptase domain-containing protein n=1 Tax=Sesamum latifolium TaxID=2727402 RepID=A0AAW2U392_9LAMI